VRREDTQRRKTFADIFESTKKISQRCTVPVRNRARFPVEERSESANLADER